jgi:exopolysaccharide production protein ExoQ
MLQVCTDDQGVAPLWERVFVVTGLIVLAGAVFPLLQNQKSSTDSAGGDPVFQLVAAVIYATVVALMFRKKAFPVIWKNKAILLLLGFAVLSVAWSQEPGITVRQSLALTGTSLFGMYLGFRYTFQEQLRLVAWALGICAVGSLLVLAVLPEYGLMSTGEYAGTWRGVFIHKNWLGETMALAASCFLLLLMGKRRRLVPIGGLLLSVFLMMGSRSMTGLAVCLILALLVPVFGVLRWSRMRLRYSLSVPMLVVAAIVVSGMGLWTVLDFRHFSLALGRDPTFSGRTYVWSAALDMLHGHSWLGYGYGAFWVGAGEEGVFTPNPAHWSLGGAGDMAQIVGWPVSHAHNGFLNLLLDLGALGMALFLIGYLLSLWRAVRWVRITKKAEDLWPLLYLAFLTLFNITESSILKRNNIFWALYVAVAVSLALRKSPPPQTTPLKELD